MSTQVFLWKGFNVSLYHKEHIILQIIYIILCWGCRLLFWMIYTSYSPSLLLDKKLSFQPWFMRSRCLANTSTDQQRKHFNSFSNCKTNWLCHPETNVAYERWGVNFSFCLFVTKFLWWCHLAVDLLWEQIWIILPFHIAPGLEISRRSMMAKAGNRWLNGVLMP